jgi:tRNA U34 5-methylaminomethyl-2-thiouridine-forming methyltransferase MnmC
MTIATSFGSPVSGATCSSDSVAIVNKSQATQMALALTEKNYAHRKRETAFGILHPKQITTGKDESLSWSTF